MFVMFELNNLLPGVAIDQGTVLNNIQTVLPDQEVWEVANTTIGPSKGHQIARRDSYSICLNK